ncbi:MAG: hypothetical protein ACREAE_02305 [Nitrosopumilaceae archaeon]
MVELQLEKVVEDNRGKILFLSYGNQSLNFVEIKKGYARGGHYHPYEQDHIFISGKIEYREEDVLTGQEQKRIVNCPVTILVPKNTAHLFIALEDTIFLEAYGHQYKATNYAKYRKLVKELM